MRRLFTAFLFVFSMVSPAMANVTTYHGFTIDSSGIADPKAASASLAGAESQIDQIEADRLPSALMQFMRGLPIRLHDREGGEGLFRNAREVNMNRVMAGDNRPVLLHEYLHAYEWFVMPGGFQNIDVHRFYDAAKAGGLYPPDSYIMKNAAEFFAVTASCFLHGTVVRPPYDRAGIQRPQPDYYAWLQQLFGSMGQ